MSKNDVNNRRRQRRIASAGTRIAVLTFLCTVTPSLFAYNVLKNSDFGTGIDGWTVSATGGGIAGYESAAGSPDSGSLRLQAYNFNSTAHAEQCVDVQKWLVIDFSLHQVDDAPSGGGSHAFKLEIYDAAGCGGTLLSTVVLPSTGTLLPDSWYEVSVLGTPLPTGAVTAKVDLDVAAGTSTVAYFLVDHVQVTPPDEIFPDNFEGN